MPAQRRLPHNRYSPFQPGAPVIWRRGRIDEARDEIVGIVVKATNHKVLIRHADGPDSKETWVPLSAVSAG